MHNDQHINFHLDGNLKDLYHNSQVETNDNKYNRDYNAYWKIQICLICWGIKIGKRSNILFQSLTSKLQD